MNSLTPKLPSKIRVLLIAGPDPFDDWVASILKNGHDIMFQGLVRDLNVALQSVQMLKPEVILINTNSGIMEHGDLINRLTSPISGRAVIVMAVMNEVEAVRQAMLHGAHGFLLKPFGQEELLSSVKQTYELVLRRRSELPNVPLLQSAQAGEPPAKAETILVFSPKGGVGCTTIAINLAVALKQITNLAVTLVDGDLRFGDIDIALNVNSSTSVASLLPKLDQLDDQILEKTLTRHSSGIKVLTAPPNIDAAEMVQPKQLDRLMRRLINLGAGHIVVDACSALNDCTLALMDLSTHMVIVSTPQVVALRDTHRALEVLKLLGYDMSQAFLILNHCYQPGAFRLKEVERILGHPIAQIIDYSPNEVLASLNQGVPLVEGYKRSRAAQNILQLAHQISAGDARLAQPEAPQDESPSTDPAKEKRRGIFRWGLAGSSTEVKA